MFAFAFALFYHFSYCSDGSLLRLVVYVWSYFGCLFGVALLSINNAELFCLRVREFAVTFQKLAFSSTICVCSENL